MNEELLPSLPAISATATVGRQYVFELDHWPVDTQVHGGTDTFVRSALICEAAVFARIRLRHVHCVLELETVAAAVSPSDKRVPHYNLAARRRLRVSVLDRNGISDLQICKDNRPQAAPA
jgi:hypothetical protein